MESEVYQFGDSMAWEDLGNGVKRQVLGYNEQLMMIKVNFEKGAVGALHQHHHTQVTYIESGVFQMTIGATVQVLKAGDGYYVPPKTIHGCVCLEAGTLIDSFSPLREDFISEMKA